MYVSLNIGGSTIKLLSLNGRQVKKWGSLALKDGLVKDGLVLEPRAVGESIGALFESTGIPRERVVASLAGLSFTYRFLKLPRLKPSLQAEAVLRAAGREMSLPLDDLYLAWQALPGPGEEQAFFVLGVPKNMVDALRQTLDAAGVPPYLVDLRPLALARAAARSDAVIVNLDADCFEIVFIAGGLPRIIHSVSPRRGEATLEDNIRQVVDELGKMAAFYLSSRPEVPLSPATPLLLAGDLAGDSPAAALLQAEVEYPVEPLAPQLTYPAGFPAASFAASVGLALKKAAPPKKDRRQPASFYDLNVDILAWRRRRARARRLPAVYVWLGVLLAIALVMLYPLYQSGAGLTTQNDILRQELYETNRQLNLAGLAAEEDARSGAAIQALSANTSARLAADRDVLSSRGDYSDILAVVTGALPPDAAFASIECDDSRVAVAGRASSVFTAVAYAAALEATGSFADVRITRLDEDTPAASDNASLPAVGTIVFEVLLTR
jgi:Tfp pilus assembly PilM family ATPase/Tfp pilus assembly protein PilN